VAWLKQVEEARCGAAHSSEKSDMAWTRLQLASEEELGGVLAFHGRDTTLLGSDNSTFWKKTV